MNGYNSVQIEPKYVWLQYNKQEKSREDWRVTCFEAHLVTGSNTWREFKWKVLARSIQNTTDGGKDGPNTQTNVGEIVAHK